MELLSTICVSCGATVPVSSPDHECLKLSKDLGVLKLPQQVYEARAFVALVVPDVPRKRKTSTNSVSSSAPPQAPTKSESSVPVSGNAKLSGDLQTAIKQLVSAGLVPEKNVGKKSKEDGAETDRQAFSLYNSLNEDLIEFLISEWRNIYLGFIPQKEEKFRAFCKMFSIAVPDDIASTAPFVDGVGPRNGKNEMRSLKGYLTFKMPKDEATLVLFEKADVSIPDGLRCRIRVETKRDERVGIIHDVKLVLTLLANHGSDFRITKYPTEAGRVKREMVSC